MFRLISAFTALSLAALVSSAVGQEAIPPDWDAVIIDACESAVDFAADQAALGDLRISATDAVRHQGRSVKWAFKAKEGADTVTLSHVAGRLTNRGALSFWLKNPEGHALRLGIRLIGSDGSAHESERVAIDDRRGWRRLVFMTDGLARAGEPAGDGAGFQFPARTLEIILEGAEPGHQYTLYLDDLVAHIAPPEELEVLSISASEASAPGEEFSARVTVRAPVSLKQRYPLTLALTGGGVTLAEAKAAFASDMAAWGAGVEIESAPLQLRVPAFVRVGEYSLRLRAPGLALSGPAARGVPVHVATLAAEPISVQVIDHNGAPTAALNGAPMSMAACLWRGNAQTAAVGDLPLLIVPATAAHDPYGWAEDVWPSRDEWDYESLDRSVIAALRAEPDARVLLRVFIETPDWWDKDNPHDTILFGHGRHAAKIPGVEGKQTYASFSSQKWRADAAEALRRFVSHIEQSPYADRVIGYVLAGGEDGRWRYWGAAEGLYADYSRPQRAAFQAWLRDKYENDIRKLRAEWQQIINPIVGLGGDEEPVPTVTAWEDIGVPAIAARASHPSHSLHDPAAVPEVTDYNLFHADQVAGFTAQLAGVAKQACEGRKLIGVSYGHVLDHARSAEALQTAGHIALDKVLVSPDIDMLAAPGMTLAGSPETAHRVWTSLAASARSHGKIWVEEILPVDDSAADLSWRTIGRVLANAGGIWYHEGLDRERLPRYARIAAASLNWNRERVSEIALVLDHYSLAYMAEGNALSAPLLAQQYASLAEVGAPFDVWLLDDLISDRMPDYKLYVMVNAFYMDQRARGAIRERVAWDRKTVLWIYAPGALDESLSGRTALELTDLAIGFVPKAAALRVKIADPSHPLVDGVPRDFEYGATEQAGPVFFALPTRGEVLGVIQVPSQQAKGEPRNWAGLIAVENDNWTSIYSAAPNVPAQILRPIARRAGVHLYLETGDVISVNASMVAVHALTSGDKRIRLLQQADVRDIISGDRIATATEGFAIAMRAGDTRLFYVGDPAQFGP